MGSKSFDLESAFFGNSSGIIDTAQKEVDKKKGGSAIIWIPCSQIEDFPSESEVYPELRDLDALARDIMLRGIRVPLKVMEISEEYGIKRYQIISGHRRFAACKIAAQEYGYLKGDSVPCTVQARPDSGNEYEAEEDMILDNLQRDKTDFERMMEIVKFGETSRQRREAGEDIPNIRDRIKERLGVSDSAITRFMKIYNSLDVTLMRQFYEGNIATSVAYNIACMEPEHQAYLAKAWDVKSMGVLNVGLVTSLLEQYANPQEPVGENSEAEIGGQAVTPVNDAVNTIAKPVIVQPQSVDDGLDMLNRTMRSITSALDGPTKMDRKTKAKIMKRIQKNMAQLLAFQNELIALGFIEPEASDGEE